MQRRLSLTREDLCDLTPDELSSFAGGAGLEETVICVRPPTLNALCAELIWHVKTTVQTITCWC